MHVIILCHIFIEQSVSLWIHMTLHHRQLALHSARLITKTITTGICAVAIQWLI